MGRPPVTARELLDHGVVAADHLTSPHSESERGIQSADRRLGRFEFRDHGTHVHPLLGPQPAERPRDLTHRPNNTPHPFQERVFSGGKIVHGRQRANLKPEMFEMLTVLRQNKTCIGEQKETAWSDSLKRVKDEDCSDVDEKSCLKKVKVEHF